jgi:hypothetical protein
MDVLRQVFGRSAVGQHQRGATRLDERHGWRSARIITCAGEVLAAAIV